MSFYTQGIRFDDLSLLLRIYKKQNKSLEEILSFFSKEENKNNIQTLYPDVMPISIQEAMKLDNSEHRMVALSTFSIEEITKDLHAERVDIKTIYKKQIRWDADLKSYTYEYEDIYELYKVDAERLGLKKKLWQDVYFVKCKDASSDRIYYLYVHPTAAKNNDAVEAIAWTMRLNGYPLTKEQYLQLMYSET